ncbi:MAG: M20/M25/M40 family metallo-hydrolase, partial [Thermoanaerobaculia bacterium]
MNRILISLTAAFLFVASTLAQSGAVRSIREYRQANENRLLGDFVEFLSIPNVASDQSNIYRNADYLVDRMKRSALNPRLLTLSDKGASPPVVYGEWLMPGATQTVIFYAHYDGQPVAPAEWTTPPWQPVFRDKPVEQNGRAVQLPAAGPIDPEWR